MIRYGSIPFDPAALEAAEREAARRSKEGRAILAEIKNWRCARCGAPACGCRICREMKGNARLCFKCAGVQAPVARDIPMSMI